MTASTKEAILAQGPTQEQRDAIFETKTEFLLRAAPGSGKTWTSCRRFIWRDANWEHVVGGLALLSFTNVAIQEFKKAVHELRKPHLLGDPNFVGTSDAFLERFVLSPFGHVLAAKKKRPRLFPGPRPGDRNNQNFTHWEPAATGASMPVYAWDIHPCMNQGKVGFRYSTRNNMKDLPVSAGQKVHNLLLQGYYTHGQRGYWCWKLLHDRPHVARVLARRFPEIIVDEAQDTNVWMVLILKILRKHGSRITLIGDPDQCIYGFGQADVQTLASFKQEWGIDELPLSKSFRCNDAIAGAARHVGGNHQFTGNGNAPGPLKKAFIVRETADDYAGSITKLQSLVQGAGVQAGETSVLCRGHRQLVAIKGTPNFESLQGKTKQLAEAVYARDVDRDHAAAAAAVQRFLRDSLKAEAYWEPIDAADDAHAARRFALVIWRFIKDKARFPSLETPAKTWITEVRLGLASLIKDLGIQEEIKFSQIVRSSGLQPEQMSQPLFINTTVVAKVRNQTIHQVKGESIDAVLVVGAEKFWNAVVKAVQQKTPEEERRIAYVAMTRARHVLLVSLPSKHYDKHFKLWESWGFAVAP